MPFSLLSAEPTDPRVFIRKPKRHRAELDPQGRLTEGLVFALLYEAHLGICDYVNPGRAFTFSGPPTAAEGDTQGNISPAGTASYITIAPAVLVPTAWTISVSNNYIGPSLPGGNSLWAMDGVGDGFFAVQGSIGNIPGNLYYGNASGVPIGTWNAANYSGWHRITVSAASNGTATFYFDGVSQGTGTVSFGATIVGILGDSVNHGNTSQQTSDMFVWNYALSNLQVAEHCADPYGSVLRPRFSRLALRGVPTAKVRPGLTLMGVGP